MQSPTQRADAPQKPEQVTVWQAVVLFFLSWFLRLWCRTLRYEMSPEVFAAASYAERPAVLLIWHNRLFLVPWILRRLRFRRPVKALVSASRDGAILASFFDRIGLDTVRGSSSRLGREALRELIALGRCGIDVAITPDGPRGPIYSMRAGAVIAARRLQAPMILFGFVFDSAWRLKSWDRFFLPKPFSVVHVRAEVIPPEAIGRGEETVELLRRRLLEINGEPLPPES